MADSVRRILEEMVPELDALEEAGYFSKAEIRSIVQRRQDFEYALQRRMPQKADFLRSIAYEVSLERLRVLRKKERNITTSRKKTTLTDYCIVRRTHKLYERMVRKFKGDLSLWNEWVEFCQSCRSSKQMSKVLTRMMQLFPTEAAVWAYAASWELEHHHNATVARSLMQTGIRMCRGDARLWVEYFRMELLYAARLVARRQVLFQGKDGGVGVGVGMGVGGGAEAGDEAGTLIENRMEQGMDDATRALLSGGVARVVYKNAMEQLAGDENDASGGSRGSHGGHEAEAVLDFLRVLRPLPILNRDELENEIIGDGLVRCGRMTDAVLSEVGNRVLGGLANFVFRRACDAGDSFQDAVRVALGVFEEFQGLRSSFPLGTYEAKVAVLGRMFEELVGSGDEDESTMLYVLNECLETGKEAMGKTDEASHDDETATGTIVLTISRIHQRLGQFLTSSIPALVQSEAREVVSERIYASNLAASLHDGHTGNDHHQSEKGGLEHPDEYNRFIDYEAGKALRHPKAWFAMIASCSQNPARLVALGELYAREQLAGVTGQGNAIEAVVGSCLANSLYLNVGIEACRSFCDAVLKGPLPGSRFIVDVAMMEQGLGSQERHIQRIRRIYDAGTDVYGGPSIEMWIEYYAFERSLGSAESKADAVYWRATQVLDDADAFVVQAQTIQSNHF